MQPQAADTELELEPVGGQTERQPEVGPVSMASADKSRLNCDDKTKLARDVCHLTARTRNNQCALHGSSEAIQQCNQSQGNTGQQQSGGPISEQKLEATTTTTSRRREPGAWRERRATAKRGVAIWPLGKQTLNNESSFGDAEDIMSPHLTGRSIRLPLAVPTSGAPTEETASHLPSQQQAQRTGGGGRPAPEVYTGDIIAGEQLMAALELALEAARVSCNYNHKRPFGHPFEKPTALWILNATGPEQINFGSARAQIKGECYYSHPNPISLNLTTFFVTSFGVVRFHSNSIWSAKKGKGSGREDSYAAHLSPELGFANEEAGG